MTINRKDKNCDENMKMVKKMQDAKNDVRVDAKLENGGKTLEPFEITSGGGSVLREIFHDRIFNGIYNLPCTNLDESDVIYGGEEKLRKKIYLIYHRFHPSLIVVLPTCVSGLIGDDIPGMIREIELPCDLIYVPSEGFAHRSRESLDVLMRDYAESWKDPSRSPAYDLRGCGHEEVMFSLADQLMEEQDVIENLVNIESFGRYTYGFESELREIRRIFNAMDVIVNLTLPTCSVEEIKRAPAAELNIVTRNIRWTEQMKNRFGTDYLRKWFFYFGFDGVENFYMDVASKLGLDGRAEETIQREKKQALEELSKYQQVFKKDDFVVSTQGFFFTPYLARIYSVDLQLPIKYLCVDTQLLKGLNISDATIELMITNMKEAFVDWDLGFEVVVDQTLDEMSELAKEVDHVLSDRITPPLYEKGGEIGMIDISATRYLLFRTGFSGIVEFGKYLVNNLRRGETKRERQPIISKFDYDETYYPILADPMCFASREMWSAMWSLKSG